MKKNNIIIGFIVLVLVLGSLSMVILGRKSVNKTPVVTPTEEEIAPTVDSSVKVTMKSKNNKRAVDLTIDGIPSSTESIEYEISYQSKQRGLQGIIGMIQVKEDEKSRTISREFGTCSSGTCIYDEVVGNIKLGLVFDGAYGKRSFDKEYEL